MRPVFQALLVLISATAAHAAADGPTRNDYERFEECRGSYEGSQSLLPKLRDQFDAADFETIATAMEHLGEDFQTDAMRFSSGGLAIDAAARNAARKRGYDPWTFARNQNFAFWAANGPMSAPCFELMKRLNEILPPWTG